MSCIPVVVEFLLRHTFDFLGHALDDLLALIFFLLISYIENSVELDTVLFELRHMDFGLREAEENEATNKRSWLALFHFENEVIYAQVLWLLLW
jgi:hypothetical protein